MQSQDQNSRTSDALNHPSAAEWMAFLYEEIPAEKKRELNAHLAHCEKCKRETESWEKGLRALDSWKLPVAEKALASRWSPLPILKFAAAAMVLLMIGFVLGRQNSAASQDIASLKKSIAELQARVASSNNKLSDSPALTRDEVEQLLIDYSKVTAEQRAQDRSAAALALREMDARIVKLRSELETVAVNTETGFRQTSAGLTQLASIAAADHGDAQTQIPNDR